MASEEKKSSASAEAPKAPDTAPSSSSSASLTMGFLFCEQQMVGYAMFAGSTSETPPPSKSTHLRQRARSLEQLETCLELNPAPNTTLSSRLAAKTTSTQPSTTSSSSSPVPLPLPLRFVSSSPHSISSDTLFTANLAGHLKSTPSDSHRCRQIQYSHFQATDLSFLLKNSTGEMPAFIPFKHGCRRFHATHIPDPSGSKKKGGNRAVIHAVTDDYGLVDLESFEVSYSPTVKETSPTRASWSPSPSEEAQLAQRSAVLKRKTHDGSGYHQIPVTSDNAEPKQAAAAATTPSTKPTPCKHNGTQGTEATTSEGDDATGGCNKKRVECSGCGTQLQGSTAFACIFPTCEVLVCHQCATLLTKHYDDGGVYGDINELKRKFGMPGSSSDEDDEVATLKPRPKKITALGAEWMRKMRERNREKQEFANRWGRSLD
ncbi:hypothetical protein K440DRAFT_679489 [Wilcoxina mikolae CBS 423.85]|nr:hypothetical protein K440DRAFT_679489 [Wilcoxina mikolae CBS 423.85]